MGRRFFCQNKRFAALNVIARRCTTLWQIPRFLTPSVLVASWIFGGRAKPEECFDESSVVQSWKSILVRTCTVPKSPVGRGVATGRSPQVRAGSLEFARIDFSFLV